MSQEFRQPVYAPPKGSADLLLIRHGESAPAREGVHFDTVDGHGDPHLHPQGHKQAERVGERLKGNAIRAIYVTKLTRTQQTAAPLAQHLALTPQQNPDLTLPPHTSTNRLPFSCMAVSSAPHWPWPRDPNPLRFWGPRTGRSAAL